MTFYVKKTLAHGPIRFGVVPRLTEEEIDSDLNLSTGPAGEFVRRRSHGFFSADPREIGAPELPRISTISSTPFWSSLTPENTGGWALIGLMVFGGFLLLLGLAVVISKGAQGWVEVIFGAALFVAPMVIIAQKRRVIQLQEEKERGEREEREKRHREAIGSYASALDRLRQEPTDANMTAATRERENLELPYKVWRPLAMRSVLHIGFDAMARLTPARSPEVAGLIDRTGAAIGLDRADVLDVKADLYQALLWHLLADDRLGPGQNRQLDEIEAAFGVANRDLSVEKQAASEFARLRGVTRDDMPREECKVPVGFREYCIYSTRGGSLIGRKASDSAAITLTNKRLIIETGKRIEVPLSKIDDVEVDLDGGSLTIRVAHPGKPITLRVDQIIYTAALIDLATTMNERPRAFA